MNYKKLYTDALERARYLYNAAMDTGYMGECKTLEVLFPELKESEDERIRKAIIEFFELQEDNTTYSFIPKQDIIAWLEKQGEKKPFDGEKEKAELKEKEDEWIRNSIIENLKGNMCRTDGDYTLLNRQINWLKKQGESIRIKEN